MQQYTKGLKTLAVYSGREAKILNKLSGIFARLHNMSELDGQILMFFNPQSNIKHAA
jgi:hypothetical protein